MELPQLNSTPFAKAEVEVKNKVKHIKRTSEGNPQRATIPDHY
jgi:hypothetical protein